MSNKNFEGDVLLYQTNDDGDVTVANGVMEMAGGLETAAYLSLFGGNEDDDGQRDSKLTWWGNLDENESERQQRSETQYLLFKLPPSSKNLLRLEGAVSRDLAWMVTTGAATSVTVAASIPAVNTLRLLIHIDVDGGKTELEFLENWEAEF